MNLLPEIPTERLILRSFSSSDADAVYRAFSDAAFTEPMLLDRQPDIIFAVTYIEELLSGYMTGNCHTWAISLKSGECIGAVSLETDNMNSAEIGYWITAKHMGRGYATEAVKAASSYAFRYLKLHRIWAKVRTDNRASVHVLKNAGFSIEGIAKDAVQRNGKYISLAYFARIGQ